MNPFLEPPDRSTRQVIDANASEPSPPHRSDSAGPLVVAEWSTWPPPCPPPDAPAARPRRWPATPLQRYTAALLALLTLGAIAVVAGLPSADAGDVLDELGSYVTTLGLGAAGAVLSIVAAARHHQRGSADDGTDELVFRVVFGALVALLLVVLLQSDTQNVVNANGQAAHLWAVIGGFGERLARRFVAGSNTPAPVG